MTDEFNGLKERYAGCSMDEKAVSAMKKRIEDICIELNIEVVKKEIYIDEINDFEFSFVTNSLMVAMKVKLIT